MTAAPTTSAPATFNASTAVSRLLPVVDVSSTARTRRPATLLEPVAAWVGGRTVHTGRIALAMAALHLGRRHAGSRLVAVLVVAIGLLTFGATAAEAARDARTGQVGADIGADQVLTVS